MADPYPTATRKGITVDNIRSHIMYDFGDAILTELSREKFYKETKLLLIGLTESGNMLIHPHEASIQRIREWPEKTRLRSAAAQLLVNQYPCTWRHMINCYGVKLDQLLGVKREPWQLGYEQPFVEHEATDCCKPFVDKILAKGGSDSLSDKALRQWEVWAEPTDLISKLMKHCRTQTHVIKKWKVGREKLLMEYERLKVILRLEGFNLEQMQHEYETIPF